MEPARQGAVSAGARQQLAGRLGFAGPALEPHHGAVVTDALQPIRAWPWPIPPHWQRPTASWRGTKAGLLGRWVAGVLSIVGARAGYLPQRRSCTLGRVTETKTWCLPVLASFLRPWQAIVPGDTVTCTSSVLDNFPAIEIDGMDLTVDKLLKKIGCGLPSDCVELLRLMAALLPSIPAAAGIM
eukprot:CAMPEP_0172944284 /NCGR_PEP_ID=MMETSP1075-20121228/225973_1 /TAXON_ID=2916 /ORGANISM="Ceratium fusus, Strain PA161109" /LENGTH=183 /DNA_ID=CAMNT_0013805711 /DNA_START=361 /DNA_END=910 /DNA_ORIENTATION=-